MRKITNLFLILFLVCAVLGISTELLGVKGWYNPFAGLQRLAESLLFLAAVAVYGGFVLDRRLPKLLLAPLLAYLGWGLLDFWPLEPVLAGHAYRLYAACGQLLLGLLMLRINRRQNGESPLLVASQFAGPGFSWRNLTGFILVSLPLVPVALLLLGYASVSGLLEEYSAGFVRLKPNGLYMIEKDYRQGEKQIRLAGMIHMGQEDFYQELAASFSAGQTLLLAEGVSDTQGLLTGKFSYGNLAELLGLSSQEQHRFSGRLIEADSLAQPLTDEAGRPDILRADIDLQDFDPRTLEVLNAIATHLLNGDSLSSGYLAFSRWAEQHITPETDQILIDDLLNKRNRAVLSYLPRALGKYRTLVIPWGALHMPGIEAAVKSRGFTLQESRERLSIDFSDLPYGRLWEHIVGDPAVAEKTVI